METVEESRVVSFSRLFGEIVRLIKFIAWKGSFNISLRFWSWPNACGDLGSICFGRRKLMIAQKQCRCPRALPRA